MQSVVSRPPACTLSWTSILMGQARVQPPQRRQARGRAARRSAGQARKLRTERPAIRNGAIQHKVWQLARRPTSRAGTKNTAATASRMMSPCRSTTEIPYQVW